MSSPTLGQVSSDGLTEYSVFRLSKAELSGTQDKTRDSGMAHSFSFLFLFYQTKLRKNRQTFPENLRIKIGQTIPESAHILRRRCILRAAAHACLLVLAVAVCHCVSLLSPCCHALALFVSLLLLLGGRGVACYLFLPSSNASNCWAFSFNRSVGGDCMPWPGIFAAKEFIAVWVSSVFLLSGLLGWH